MIWSMADGLPVVIWGCGGFAREVNALCRELGRPVAGFLDERPEMAGVVVDGVRVVGDLPAISHLRGEAEVLCAGVGSPQLKRHFWERTREAGHRLSRPLVHPGVRLAASVEVEEGAVITAGCVLTVGIRVRAHAALNLLCTVGHDAIIGRFATLSPGVMVSGNVMIGDGAFLGSNAAVREKIHIGEDAVIGGGAFVAADVPARTLFVGVPAKWKRDL